MAPPSAGYEYGYGVAVGGAARERGSAMAEVKFYRCNHCGNVVAVVRDGGVTPSCCGEPMELLVAGSTDAATEKHVPVATRDGNHIVVRVGAVDHPMAPEHYIEWIALATDGKLCLKHLKPGDEPATKFGACCAEGGTVYAYCNLHGLWKADL